MKVQKRLNILYEDDEILALDKPSGLLVVPDRWDKKQETLMDHVRNYLKSQAWPAHRLDQEASGVVLFAKNPKCRTFLGRQFEKREVKKVYEVLVQGTVSDPEGVIRFCISEDPRRPGRVRTGGRYGKDATTDFQVLECFRAITLLEVRPLTGRQHQIRIHLQAVGHPVLCDPLYGSPKPFYLSEMKRFYKYKEEEEEKPLMGRLALHAREITFRKMDDKEQSIQTNLPKDFGVFLKYLRKFWK